MIPKPGNKCATTHLMLNHPMITSSLLMMTMMRTTLKLVQLILQLLQPPRQQPPQPQQLFHQQTDQPALMEGHQCYSNTIPWKTLVLSTCRLSQEESTCPTLDATLGFNPDKLEKEQEPSDLQKNVTVN